MTWIWTDHGNLDTAPQLQLEDGQSLHVTAGPEVEMETLLQIAALPELVAALEAMVEAFMLESYLSSEGDAALRATVIALKKAGVPMKSDLERFREKEFRRILRTVDDAVER